jgi:ABC-2 type transport system permease protein
VRRADLRLAVREVGVQTRAFWRNPIATVGMVLLPVVLLPLAHAINSKTLVLLPGSPASTTGWTVSVGTGGRVIGFGSNGSSLLGAPYDQYLVPVLAAFGVATACFGNLVIRLTVAREQGVLKRLRAAPIPTWVHLAGRVGSSVLVGLWVAVTTLAVGVALYSVRVPWTRMAIALLATVLAAAAFCALGFLLASVLPNGDAAPPVVLAVLFPLAFVSNVYFPPQVSPAWMRSVAAWLPLEPYTTSVATAFNPTASGAPWSKLGALSLWATVSVVAALWLFRWTPTIEAARATQRRPRPVMAIAVVIVLVIALLVGWNGRRAGVSSTIAVGRLDSFADGKLERRQIYMDRTNPNAQLLSMLTQRGDGTIDVFVLRSGASARVFPANSFGAGCRLVPASDVDPEWEAAVGLTNATGAVLVDPCAPAAYAPDGSCLAGQCAPLVALPTQLDNGIVHVVMNRVAAADSPEAGSSPPSTPRSYAGTTVYHNGPAEQDAVVWDSTGVQFSQLGASTRPTVKLKTLGPDGASIQGVEVDGANLLGYGAPLPWLSLAVGAADTTSESIDALTITRTGRRSWTLTAPQARLTLAVEPALPPWTSVDLTIELLSQGAPPRPFVQLSLTS